MSLNKKDLFRLRMHNAKTYILIDTKYKAIKDLLLRKKNSDY